MRWTRRYPHPNHLALDTTDLPSCINRRWTHPLAPRTADNRPCTIRRSPSTADRPPSSAEHVRRHLGRFLSHITKTALVLEASATDNNGSKEGLLASVVDWLLHTLPHGEARARAYYNDEC